LLHQKFNCQEYSVPTSQHSQNHWTSPEGKMHNQTDDALTDKKMAFKCS